MGVCLFWQPAIVVDYYCWNCYLMSYLANKIFPLSLPLSLCYKSLRWMYFFRKKEQINVWNVPRKGFSQRSSGELLEFLSSVTGEDARSLWWRLFLWLVSLLFIQNFVLSHSSACRLTGEKQLTADCSLCGINVKNAFYVFLFLPRFLRF